MNDCWNFFRYAEISQSEEITALFNKNKMWFSHLDKNHFIRKIKKKECIYESGILITFKILSSSSKLGTFAVEPGNTILEQIIKNQEKSNSDLLRHTFIKFVNCAVGSVYLAVNKKNTRAINFYNNMKMEIVSETKLDYKESSYSCEFGYIFKGRKSYFKNFAN